MVQKVLKVGDSAAVTIPKKSLGELDLKIGDKINVTVDRKQRVVLVEPIKKTIDKELLDWTRKFIKEYKPALDALAKK